jgi:hypothetical protein
MTFFPTLMRAIAAAGASALLILIPNLIAVFQGPAPTDISAVVWGILGTAAVFGLNFLLGKVRKPAVLDEL